MLDSLPPPCPSALSRGQSNRPAKRSGVGKNPFLKRELNSGLNSAAPRKAHCEPLAGCGRDPVVSPECPTFRIMSRLFGNRKGSSVPRQPMTRSRSARLLPMNAIRSPSSGILANCAREDEVTADSSTGACATLGAVEFCSADERIRREEREIGIRRRMGTEASWSKRGLSARTAFPCEFRRFLFERSERRIESLCKVLLHGCGRPDRVAFTTSM